MGGKAWVGVLRRPLFDRCCGMLLFCLGARNTKDVNEAGRMGSLSQLMGVGLMLGACGPAPHESPWP